MDGAANEPPDDDRPAGLIIPESMQDIWRCHALNAMYLFKKKNLERKREQLSGQRREENSRLIEEERGQVENEFPSRSFKWVDDTAANGPDVKGSVMVQGGQLLFGSKATFSNGSRKVVTCFLSFVHYRKQMTNTSPSFAMKDFLLKDVVTPLKKKKMTKRKDWCDIEFDTSIVKRGTQEVHFVTKGPLKNCTCDAAMAESLRQVLCPCVLRPEKCMGQHV